MACDPKTLEATAKCFACLSDKDLKLVEIALLVQWALSLNPAADVTPKGLLSQAKCFTCLPAKDREMAELALLCQISP